MKDGDYCIENNEKLFKSFNKLRPSRPSSSKKRLQSIGIRLQEVFVVKDLIFVVW